MKGPNPFVQWEDDPSNICGRKDESRIFNSFANAASSGQGGVLVVVGGPGEGKTMLLRHFKSEAEGNGMLSPYVNAERSENEQAIVDKIFQEVRSSPDYKHVSGAPESLEKLLNALEKADKSGFGSIIFIDDGDRIRNAPEFMIKLAKAAKGGWGKRKIGIVVSMTSEQAETSDIISVMRLKPLDEHDAHEMMEKALKKGPPKMGDECLSSILIDSGGNPRLIKSVCRYIYEKLRDNEKVITKGHYLGYLQYIMSMLSREWFGRMYQETPAAERLILHELAKNEDGMHVSDIAKNIGKPLGPVTALTKRLLDSGQIVRVDRGKYRVFAKLYARYVSQRS